MSKEINILFIDDEDSDLYLFEKIFLDWPFGVVTTKSTEEAFEILRKEKIKVVVSDQYMPVIPGIHFLREVKNRFPNVVRILLTGHEEFEVAEQAINMGEVYRFLTKPFNTAEFKAAIRQSLQHYNLCEENERLFEDMRRKSQELEIINRELRSLQKIQQDFISTVSHELRTPLASIKSAVEILASETAGPLNQDQKSFLHKAQKHIDRLKSLSDDVLDMTSLEAGTLDLEIKPNNINEIIQKEIKWFMPDAINKKLYINADLQDGIPLISMDGERIKTVMSNLIDNAITFTEKGGVFIISRKVEDKDEVQVCVKDTGVGIPENDLSKVFNKFHQIGSPEKRAAGGAGIGLAICRDIIRLHGGRIWAESKLNEGSHFYFTLPLKDEHLQRKEDLKN